MLTGDVMCGRGIDQILPFPSSPVLYESWVKDAREYIRIAEELHGTIPRPVDHSYVWGESIGEINRLNPHLRITNLETSITTSNTYWPTKGINYRMHPANTGFLSAARIDCCAVANNHVLDWDRPGLIETMRSLKDEGIRFAGAGMNRQEALAPAVLVTGHCRVLLFSLGFKSSGIPPQWAATETESGVAFFSKISESALETIRLQVRNYKKPGDVVIVSIHWGDNWDYSVYPHERRFAHDLIDTAQVDIIHGHSSHHIKGIEVHNDRLILYGCGDFINDYEGIGGNELFRGDLSAAYFATINNDNGVLAGLEIVPFVMNKFSLRKAGQEDVITVTEILNREGKPLGTGAAIEDTGTLVLKW